MRRTGRSAMPLLLLALAAGCGGRAEEEPAAVPAEGDTAAEGLSSEELRARAEPMSPAEAEELGIIDTTIHLEQPTSPADSALLADSLGLFRPDTTG